MPIILRGRRVLFETGGPPVEPPRWEPPPDPCPFCGKDRKTHPERLKGFGTSVDSSMELARNILADASRDEHRWYTGLWSLAAHHLICGEAMDNDFWWEVCSRFAYSINHRNNGIMLPHDMALACQLGVPVHRGSHSAGHADDPDLSYPDGVKRRLDRVKAQLEAGQFCMNPAALRTQLDALSSEILQEVSAFRWTLSWDGEEYEPGTRRAGCGGFKSIQARREAAEQGRNPSCPHQRTHGLRHARTGEPLPTNTRPLEIGT
jgi:hypothetical protein